MQFGFLQAGDTVEDILTLIETNLQDLEHCNSNCSLSNSSRERLAVIVTRIHKLLDENG